MNKQHILGEIKRTAETNGGTPALDDAIVSGRI